MRLSLRRHASRVHFVSNSFGPIHFVLEHFRLYTLGFEHVSRHVGHLIHLHVGHHIVVSTLQEVSEMLTEWKSKSVPYGSRTTDGRMDAENPLRCASDSLAFQLSERKRGGKRGRWPSLSAPPPFTRSSPRWSPPWRWFLTSSFCCFLAAFHFLTFVQQDSHSRQPQFCARFANSIAKMMMMTYFVQLLMKISSLQVYQFD